MINYNRHNIDETDIKKVVKILRSNYLTQGPSVKVFEKKFSDYVKSKFSISFNSCTSALHSAVAILNLNKNDYVWTTPNSFVASSNCVLFNGNKLDFVDIDSNTGSMSLYELKKKLSKTPKNKLPKAIINVHFAGVANRQFEIWKLSKKYGFKIIEDACHALGGSYLGEKVGSCRWSDLCVFSFHAIKSITTGEGGMVTTNNTKFAKKLELIKSHGISRNIRNINNKGNYLVYDQKLLGYNFRLTEFQAALGINQLKKLNYFIDVRKKIATYYFQKLKKQKLEFLTIDKNVKSSFHLLVIRVSKKIKKKLIEAFLKKKIFVSYHYIPIYKHSFYKKIGFKNYKLKSMEKYQQECVSLPIHTKLKFKEIDKIIKVIKTLT